MKKDTNQSSTRRPLRVTCHIVRGCEKKHHDDPWWPWWSWCDGCQWCHDANGNACFISAGSQCVITWISPVMLGVCWPSWRSMALLRSFQSQHLTVPSVASHLPPAVPRFLLLFLLNLLMFLLCFFFLLCSSCCSLATCAVFFSYFFVRECCQHLPTKATVRSYCVTCTAGTRSLWCSPAGAKGSWSAAPDSSGTALTQRAVLSNSKKHDNIVKGLHFSPVVSLAVWIPSVFIGLDSKCWSSWEAFTGLEK